VLLDCTAIPAHRGGVGRYIEGLLAGLSPDEVVLSLAVQRRDRRTLAALAPWAEVYAVPSLLRIRLLRLVWEQVSLPGLASRLGVEVVHSPHYTRPRGWTGGRVVTVHDATFFSHPETHRPLKRWFFRMWTKRSWRVADVVITPSIATGDEVTRFIGKPKGVLEVAYLGVDLSRFHPPTADEVESFRAATASLKSRRWFAFLGTIEPRKNVLALLEGYRLLREEFAEETPDLLISGGRGWDTHAVARLNALPSNSGVRELGYVPATSLAELLGGAVAVVYPSVGEGFGLPVLEAMASGAAVITTRRLAIPEVGGDAVLYIEPNAEEIRDALRELLTNPDENERLRALATLRASLFTWHATAKHHVTAYEIAAAAAAARAR
jgi:glycosyltransferase involved in cell wall biosynthesis